VIEIRQRSPDSLESRAASINRHIDLFLRADASAQSNRIAAGQELIAAKEMVEHGKWEAWCAANIKRSQRDIQRLMKIAGSDDPIAALEQERDRAREGMAEHRSEATNVSRLDEDEDPVERIFRSFIKLNEDQRGRHRSSKDVSHVTVARFAFYGFSRLKVHPGQNITKRQTPQLRASVAWNIEGPPTWGT
jgi:Protein of unknown function (DUF3102)